ncbi:GNAT family N-acetyltransferase [Microbacterium gorillae]|uniref:GNAT family N-acetyltransferase n=1 Tax=Microbacterium gorillae TaxID=1231063 RepID=UPI000694551F|nr:GNAT family protein [Microbacterium gorillae]
MTLDALVTLSGTHVRLEPLRPDHVFELREAVAEPHEDLWFTTVPTPVTLADDVAERLAKRDAGTMNPFVTRRLDDGRLVGETTFCNLDLASPRTEIGYTWLAPSAQRTPINTEAKLLMLTYAFEECEVIAVEFRSHFHNRRSRAAIERLGAKLDGILRNHRYGPDGTLRDTAAYSILPHEWPTVRQGLLARLTR